MNGLGRPAARGGGCGGVACRVEFAGLAAWVIGRNLTDRRYWNPQDVTGQSRTGSTDLERYVQPGRTVAVNAIVKW